MSDELVQSLNRRIRDLEELTAKYQAARTQARHESKDLRVRVTALDEEVKSLSAQRDTWKARAESAPSEQSARIVELERQLATRDHRDMFRSEAMGAGVNPSFIDDLYVLSGLKPGDSPVQSGSFAEFLEVAKTSRPWAFGSQPSGQNGVSQPSGQNGIAQAIGLGATASPPGAGRSASAAPVNGVRYTAQEVRQPGWQQARPELVEALQRGTAVFVE